MSNTTFDTKAYEALDKIKINNVSGHWPEIDEDSLKLALVTLSELHQQETLKEKIQHKLDEVNLIPEHPDANIGLYKDVRRMELSELRTNLNNTGDNTQATLMEEES